MIVHGKLLQRIYIPDAWEIWRHGLLGIILGTILLAQTLTLDTIAPEKVASISGLLALTTLFVVVYALFPLFKMLVSTVTQAVILWWHGGEPA